MKNPRRVFCLFVFATLISSPVFSSENRRQTAVVKEVLTGDTVRLAGGKTLKYASLSAPPLQSIIPLVRTYGETSLQFNKNLVEGKTIQIEWGPKIRDEYGHLLAYVWLEDGTFVNDTILKAGQAKHLTAPPNIQHSAQFRRSELDARRDKLGLWKDEPENPYIQSECLGEKNTKIYYFPTSPELDRIPEANLIKFRSRVEAKAAGYKACSTCKEGLKAGF